MNELLERLKRERRWSVALFLAVVTFIALVQFVLAPDQSSRDDTSIRPAAGEAHK